MNPTTVQPSRTVEPWQLAGLLAFAPHLLAVMLATAWRPGFDHRLQYLSELGERGSTTAALMNFFGIVPTGLLFMSFGFSVLASYRAHRLLAAAGALVVLHGICRPIAAFFPCDVGCRPELPSLSQTIHNFSATIAFVSLTAALFVAGPWLVARKCGALIITATYALGFVAVAAQAILVTAPGGNLGLYQRLALGALQAWVAVLALHFMSGSPEARDAS
jgi:hypothetical membrane protein